MNLVHLYIGEANLVTRFLLSVTKWRKLRRNRVTVCLPDIHEAREILKDNDSSLNRHLEICFGLNYSSESFRGSYLRETCVNPIQNFDFLESRIELATQEFDKIRRLYRTLCELILQPDQHIKFLFEKSQFVDRVADEIYIYLSEYEDILKEEIKVSLSKLIRILKVNSLGYNGLYLLAKSTREKSPIEQVRKYSTGINFILRCVEYAVLCNPQKIDEILEIDAIKLIINNTLEYQFSSETDLKNQGVSKNKRRKIIAYIESAKSDVLIIQKKLETYGLIQLKGIPFELEGETIYLSPNSAEGKALSRINNPVPDDEWVVLVEEGQEVDFASALERLKKRGYKVKV
jgi:hypothetical protein